jgi:hypothetical protein
VVGRAVLERVRTRSFEPHIDDGSLRGSEQHFFDEGLVLVPTAVTPHELHLDATQRDVEQPRVAVLVK